MVGELRALELRDHRVDALAGEVRQQATEDADQQQDYAHAAAHDGHRVVLDRALPHALEEVVAAPDARGARERNRRLQGLLLSALQTGDAGWLEALFHRLF